MDQQLHAGVFCFVFLQFVYLVSRLLMTLFYFQTRVSLSQFVHVTVTRADKASPPLPLTDSHTQQVKTETNRAEQWRSFHLHRKKRKRERAHLLFCYLRQDHSGTAERGGDHQKERKKTSVSVPLKWKWTHGSVSVGFEMMWQWFHLLMSRMSMKTSEVSRTADFTSHTRPSWYTPNSPRWAAPLYISQLIRRVLFFKELYFLFVLLYTVEAKLYSSCSNVFLSFLQMSYDKTIVFFDLETTGLGNNLFAH